MNGVEADRRTREVLAELERRVEHACTGCGRPLCAHAYVFNLALGYRAAPRCVDCLAASFRRSRADLLEHLLAWVEARPCYAAGWSWAAQEESPRDPRRPACLWRPDDGATPAPPPAAAPAAAPAGPVPHDAEWDAGGMGCGDLVLELRTRIRDLAPGRVLLLTATDPGAPTDLPAWCRLTGNRLAGQEHPRYWIEKGKKGN